MMRKDRRREPNQSTSSSLLFTHSGGEVDRRRLLQLWRNKELGEFIESQARRYFQNTADMEEAVTEAWSAVEYCSEGTSSNSIRHAVCATIRTKYMRKYRDRKKGRVNISDSRPSKNVNG